MVGNASSGMSRNNLKRSIGPTDRPFSGKETVHELATIKEFKHENNWKIKYYSLAKSEIYLLCKKPNEVR